MCRLKIPPNIIGIQEARGGPRVIRVRLLPDTSPADGIISLCESHDLSQDAVLLQ